MNVANWAETLWKLCICIFFDLNSCGHDFFSLSGTGSYRAAKTHTFFVEPNVVQETSKRDPQEYQTAHRNKMVLTRGINFQECQTEECRQEYRAGGIPAGIPLSASRQEMKARGDSVVLELTQRVENPHAGRGTARARLA